jgi:putative DNA primase/helicase
MNGLQSKTPVPGRAAGGFRDNNQHHHSASFLSKSQPPAPLTQSEIARALFYIPSDCNREQWARIGMALKHELGDAAFELFERWSVQAGTSNARDIHDTWRSIKAGGAISIGTLLFEAKKHGWQRAPRAPMTTSERAAAEQAALLTAQQREAREQAERLATEQRHQQAAATAQRLVATLPAASPDHAYLVRKGVQPHGILQSGSVLVVPVRDVNGTVVSHQNIDASGEKRFAYGGRTSGCFFTIGESLSTCAFAVVCEGFATGSSLHERVGSTVVVAFNAGNLKPVATTIREAFPLLDLAIAADWDGLPDGGVGVAKATEAARAVNAELWIPVAPAGMTAEQFDFNDVDAFQRAQLAGKKERAL